MERTIHRLARSLALLGCLITAVTAHAGAPPSKSLAPFSSDKELLDYLTELKRRAAAESERPSFSPSSPGSYDMLAEAVVTGSRASESITNTQTEGVDEGGIVKLHGRHLVVLRRGRLFTIDIADRSLRPVAWINAYAPGIDPESTWYDEMLIHRDRIIVIGYSYDRGGTEVALFDIDAKGRLQHAATYHLRSDDYYSSRNYASRLTDGKLVFYTPAPLSDLDSLPALRRWPSFAPRDKRAFEDRGFARIAPATRIYRPARDLASPAYPILHTITTCDVDAAEFSCKAVGVIGDRSEVFYVSRTAVYVWVGPSWRAAKNATSMLYRLPLDGSLPGAMQTAGNPIDQFSFLEHDGHINVLVGSGAKGTWMWRSEQGPGSLALLRAPLTDLGAGSAPPKNRDYLPLPKIDGHGALHNRFVGERLLYGAGNGWGDPEVGSAPLRVVDIGTRNVTTIPLAHGVDRIEALGANAIVIGADHDEALHFSGIDLTSTPRQHRHYEFPDASQAELRSHGFFYSPTTLDGALGLPVSGGGSAGWHHLRKNAAAILFLRLRKDDFEEVGLLQSEAEETDDDDDGCQASCVDWYGNARPLFIAGRIYALLGYELVEGRVEHGRLTELQRANFSPYVGP